MDNIALASINSFALGAPSSDLLERILLELQGLNDEVANLRDENTNLKDEVQELRDKSEQDRITIERQQLVIDLYIDPDIRVLDPSNDDCENLRDAAKRRTKAARDFSVRISDLEDHVRELEGLKEPQPAQRDRGEILRALLAANGGKMLAKDARKTMRLPENRFSELLTSQNRYIEVKTYSMDKRQKLLVLLPRK